MSEDLEEYRQILAFLQSSKTQVLAPLDGEGREFWVNAEADPKDGLELDIDGQTRHYTQKEAIVVVQRKIAELQRDV